MVKRLIQETWGLLPKQCLMSAVVFVISLSWSNICLSTLTDSQNFVDTKKNGIEYKVSPSLLSFKRVQLFINSPDTETVLRKLGIDYQNNYQNKVKHAEFVLSDAQCEELAKYGIDYDILQNNYQDYLSDKLKNTNFNDLLLKIQQSDNKFVTSDSTVELVPKGFKFGSYFNYFALNEIYSEFDKLVDSYPQNIKKVIIGYSVQNNPIYCWQFNFTKSSETDKVLFTGLHHSREPITASTLVYSADFLLENYFSGGNQEYQKEIQKDVKFILDNFQIHFVPCLNPDGYLININTGKVGYWRKNAREFDGKIVGVDLNRNYGPAKFWNYPDTLSSSSNPYNDTYRGLKEFSEPETQAIKKICDSNKYRLAINFHSFGNSYIYPFLSVVNSQDKYSYSSFGAFNYKKNKFAFGIDSMLVGYKTRGNSDDWMFYQNTDSGNSEEEKKDYSIIASTIELDDTFYQTDSVKLLNSIISGKNYIVNSFFLLDKLPYLKNYQFEEKKGGTVDSVKVDFLVENIGFKSIENLAVQIKRNEFDKVIQVLDLGGVAKNQTVSFSLCFAKDELVNSDSSLTFYYYSGFIDKENLLRKEKVRIRIAPFTNQVLFDKNTSTEDLKRDFRFFKKNEECSLQESTWGFQQVDSSFKVLTESVNSLYDTLSYSYLRLKKNLSVNSITNGIFYQLVLSAIWQVERKYDHIFCRVFDATSNKYYYLENEYTNRRVIKENNENVTGEYSILDAYFPYQQQLRFDINKNLPQNINSDSLFVEIGLVSDKTKNYDGLQILKLELLEFQKNKVLSVEENKKSKSNFITQGYRTIYVEQPEIRLNLENIKNIIGSKDSDELQVELINVNGEILPFKYDFSGGDITVKLAQEGVSFLTIRNLKTGHKNIYKILYLLR